MRQKTFLPARAPGSAGFRREQRIAAWQTDFAAGILGALPAGFPGVASATALLAAGRCEMLGAAIEASCSVSCTFAK